MTSAPGESITGVFSAQGLLGAFFLGLVLFGAAGTFSGSAATAKAEADQVDGIYESAEYVDQPFRQEIQAASVCYARAVAGPEWDAMAGGKSSPVPANWTGTGAHGMRKVFVEMTPKATGFGNVVSADQERGSLRSDRLNVAKPQIPPVVFWFTVMPVAFSLAGLAFAIPQKKNTGHLVALALVTLLFFTVLAMIGDFDRPFGGVLKQKPTAMLSVAVENTAHYAESYNTPLPCDDLGHPK